MEQNYRRVSQQLKLSQESRERIRAQLIAHQILKEEPFMHKSALKKRVSLLAAAAVLTVALAVTAAAAVTHLFRNDIIVPSLTDIPLPAEEDGGPSAVAVRGASDAPPVTLEEIAKSARAKSEDWAAGEQLGGGVLPDYAQWDTAEVLSSDPALRVRRVQRSDGAEKMEYTAEDPASLMDTLTGQVVFDLTYMDGQYQYVPDANLSFVVRDADGSYVSEDFSALYAKPDGSGYVQLQLYSVAPADYFTQSYVAEDSYDSAYYHTTPQGYEFLITAKNGKIWADCATSHASVGLFGAHLTNEEVESILDSLSLSIQE